jgi:High-temperature-induced dauer-formation protein
MGASESKLVFKQGIFRLSEDQAIPPGDPYWTGVSHRAITTQVQSLIAF